MGNIPPSTGSCASLLGLTSELFFNTLFVHFPPGWVVRSTRGFPGAHRARWVPARSLRRAPPVPPCTCLTRAPKTSRLWAQGEPVVSGVPGSSPTHRCLQTELTKARVPASRLWGFHQASPARSSGLGHAGEAEELPSPELFPSGELSLLGSQIFASAFAPPWPPAAPPVASPRCCLPPAGHLWPAWKV